LQLINGGFNPLQVMSEKTGKSMSQLKDEMSKGAISFEMVEQAFKDATGEGGLFFDMMEKQSNTLAGTISTLEGGVADLMRQFGEGMLPELKAVTGAMLELAGAMGDVAEARKLISGGDIDVGQGMAADIGTLAVANLDEALANVFEALPGESLIAKKLRERVETLRDTALGGVESAASSEAEKRAEKKRQTEKLDETDKEPEGVSVAAIAAEAAILDDFVNAGIQGEEDYAEFVKLRKELALKAAEETFDKKKAAEADLLGGQLDAAKEQASKLQTDIGAAFQPGGKIQSRLARIGGERTINVDRQIPQKQLDQLMELNKVTIPNLQKSIEANAGTRF
jgi:hypothetical protein